MDQQQPPATPPPPPPQPWQSPPPEPGPAPGIRFAEHGARLMAYIVDALILGAIGGAVTLVLLATTLGSITPEGEIGGGGIAVIVLVILVAVAITVAYFPYSWWKWGATPGMRAFGLRVVRDADGGPISGGQAVMRLVGYWINQVALYIGFAWILVDKRRRGWHDLIAGTCVIQAP